MNKLNTLMAGLLAGLLLFCLPVDAATIEGGTIELLPDAGITEFINDTEVPGEPHYIDTFVEPIEPVYYISDEEADLLMRIATLEGGEGNVEGMAHVMQVVLNRVESDKFPNSISEVVFQNNPTQFTTADKLANANITPEAYVALDAVIFGEYQYNDCHFFESCDGLVFSSWADYTFSFGGHDFYKVKGV